jgi:hypothetical protein
MVAHGTSRKPVFVNEYDRFRFGKRKHVCSHYRSANWTSASDVRRHRVP